MAGRNWWQEGWISWVCGETSSLRWLSYLNIKDSWGVKRSFKGFGVILFGNKHATEHYQHKNQDLFFEKQEGTLGLSFWRQPIRSYKGIQIFSTFSCDKWIFLREDYGARA